MEMPVAAPSAEGDHRRSDPPPARWREDFIQRLQEIAQVGGFDWDVRNNHFQSTSELVRLHGGPPDASINTIDELLAPYLPVDRVRLELGLRLCLTGSSQNGADEFRAQMPDGSIRTHWVSWKGFFDSGGVLYRLIGTALDITERKQSEERIRISEHELNEAQRVAGMGSWERDLVANTASWSAQLYHLYGVSPETFDPNRFDAYLELVHPDDREKITNLVETGLRTKEPFDGLIRMIRPDGKELQVYLKAAVVADASGRPVVLRGISQDVTTRQRLATQLREREDELKLAGAIIENAVDGITLVRPDGRFANVNRAACTLLGYARSELLQLTVPDIDPQQAPHTWPDFWADLRSRGSATMERSLRRKNGDMMPFEISARYLLYGEQEYIASVMRDVSERHRMLHELGASHRELRESHRRFRDLFNEAPEGVFRTRISDGLIIDVNPAFARIVGYPSPEALRGQSTKMLYVDYAVRERSVAVNRVKESIESLEARWRKADGAQILVEISGRVVLDEHGEPSLFQGFVRDVTAERERAVRERALLEHKEQLELVIEGTQLGFWDWNPQTGYVVFSNRWAEMLGYRAEELVPHIDTSCNLVHPEDFPRCVAAMKAHLRGDTPSFQTISRLHHRDGRWLYIMNRGKVFERDAAGRPTRVCGTHTDITTEKEAEQAAVEANRAKTHFLANMSHELRTPLNAVLGLSEALLEGTYRDEPAKQQRSLKMIHDSGKHLLSLITDVLDIARIDAGKYSLSLEVVDVQPLLGRCVSYVIDMAEQRGQRIVVSEDLRAHVMADRHKLKQVLINLLTNAIKYSPRDTTIWLGGARVEERAQVELWVSDRGPGIPAADRERIFEPFVRLNEAYSAETAGTGLGLALVKRIVEQHSGSIRAEEAPGGGSRFVVTLPELQHGPRAAPHPPLAVPLLPPQPSRQRSSSGQAPLVLLVEDNEANIFVTRGHLEAAGYRVKVARDGLSAVAAAADPEVALILMDIQLPWMDGLEATRKIRAAERGARKPIIALTAYSLPDDEARCLAAGADRYLSKPVARQELADAMEGLLNPGAEDVR